MLQRLLGNLRCRGHLAAFLGGDHHFFERQARNGQFHLQSGNIAFDLQRLLQRLIAQELEFEFMLAGRHIRQLEAPVGIGYGPEPELADDDRGHDHRLAGAALDHRPGYLEPGRRLGDGHSETACHQSGKQ